MGVAAFSFSGENTYIQCEDLKHQIIRGLRLESRKFEYLSCFHFKLLTRNAEMQYRVVQLNFSPEIEVFYMLLERSLSIFSMTSLKQNIEYFSFRCEIQLDLPVHYSSSIFSVTGSCKLM